jgi:hypothetical protein
MDVIYEIDDFKLKSVVHMTRNTTLFKLKYKVFQNICLLPFPFDLFREKETQRINKQKFTL